MFPSADAIESLRQAALVQPSTDDSHTFNSDGAEWPSCTVCKGSKGHPLHEDADPIRLPEIRSVI